MATLDNPIPSFKHDCNACLYLGGHYLGGKRYELYLCPSDLFAGGSLVARFSDDGPDYMSGIVFGVIHFFEGNYDHPLAVAYARACGLGLLNAEHPLVDCEIWRHFGEPAVERVVDYLFKAHDKAACMFLLDHKFKMGLQVSRKWRHFMDTRKQAA